MLSSNSKVYSYNCLLYYIYLLRGASLCYFQAELEIGVERKTRSTNIVLLSESNLFNSFYKINPFMSIHSNIAKTFSNLLKLIAPCDFSKRGLDTSYEKVPQALKQPKIEVDPPTVPCSICQFKSTNQTELK